MKISIGSNVRVPEMSLYEGSFEDFCKSISDISGEFTKINQPFFCATADYNPLYRTDENLEKEAKYSVIIIDGDSGIDDNPISKPNEIHKFLKKQKLNHIVLSSWGNGYDKDKDCSNSSVVKWRAIIEAKGVTSSNLENTSRAIVSKMQKAGLSIAYAYENHTPSRAWFFGGCFDKKLFESFSLYNANALPKTTKTTQVKESICVVNGNQANKEETLQDIMKVLISGGSGYHLAQNKYAWMMSKDGVNEFMIKAQLQSFALIWKNDSERWDERYNDINKCVESAILKNKQPKLKEIKQLTVVKKEIQTGCEFEKLPGICGVMQDEFMERMRYPLESIAIIGILHSIAVFAGNQYNCRGVNLTQKRVLLAKSGVGKNSVLAWMNHIVTNAKVGLSNTTEKMKLIGNTGYTSARVLHLELQEHPVKSIIASEAGKSGASTAGDMARLSAHFLMVFGNLFDDVLVPFGMATGKSDVTMKPLYNINVQMLSESVPDSYIDNMIADGDIEDGNLSRAELIFIDASKETPKINAHNSEHTVKEEVMNVYSCLFRRFQRFGNKNATEFKEKHTKVLMSDEVSKRYAALEFKGLSMSRKSNDGFISALWNRRHVKTLKTAMILAIAESALLGRNDELVEVNIAIEQWEWAEKYQNKICDVLEVKQKIGIFDNGLVAVLEALKEKLLTIKENPTYIRKLTKSQQEYNCITGYMLDKLVYRKKDFQKIVDTIYRGKKMDAIRAFLAYAEEVQVLTRLTGEDARLLNFRGKTNYTFNI